MNSECCICMEIIRTHDTQKPFATRCGHLFHENCIKNCLKSASYGKCPQCNQPVIRSQLIRLYVNEPENSVKTKDELIDKLKGQLHELNEKAQLQYDLIGSLNRQIALEKKLSQKVRNRDFDQPNASDSPSSRGSKSPESLVAPSKLIVRGTKDEGCSSQPVFRFANGPYDNPFYKFATGTTSQNTHGSGGIFQKLTPATSTFTFGGTNNQETSSFPQFFPMQSKLNGTNECGSSKPMTTTWLGNSTTNTTLPTLATQNGSSNPFTFGSQRGSGSSFSNFEKVFSDFWPKDSSKITFDRGCDAFQLQPAASSTSQNTNLFTPSTQSSTMQKSISMYRSSSTTANNARKKTTTNAFDGWRIPSNFDASNVSSQFNSSTGRESLLQLNVPFLRQLTPSSDCDVTTSTQDNVGSSDVKMETTRTAPENDISDLM